jgi:hypothetical protein
MKVELNVELAEKNGLWDLYVGKKLEMDFLPNVGEEIEDNGLFFKVDSRTFYLKGYVHIMLKQGFEITEERDKKAVLNRMHDTGWLYRDDSDFDIRNMA